ncbi:MAG: polysaccharide biosynthesis/export family protein [bacterium]
MTRLHSPRLVARNGALALALFLGGCVPPIPVTPEIQPVARGTNQWLVESGDVIRLRTWLTTDQSGDLPVNERGQVLVPNVGRLTVVGLSPAAVETQIVRAYAGRLDSSRVEVTFLRPVSVVGGVKSAGVQLADPSSSVLSLISRAGGPIRSGGDLRAYLLRVGEPTREISTADRVSELGIRSTDQLYVQDPPFVIRNQVAITSVFEVLSFVSSTLTILFLLRN